MQQKKFYIYTLTLITIFSTIIIAFNVVVDPYGVLNLCNIYKFNKEKPELKTNERISKLFTAKIKKYDTLFIGSSRTDFALDPKHYYNLTKKKALNLGIGGSDISESKIILQKLIKTHPNLKTIILEVDYFGFNSTHKINSNEKIDSYISLNDFFKLFLSYDSIKKSISTINYNFKTPNKFIYDYNGLRIKTPEHNSYNLALAEINGVLTKNKNYSLDISRLQNLQEIKRLCKQNNIKLIVFVSPLNFAEIHGINLTGNFNKYLNWRKEISKITSFYDFSMGNYITYEPLKPHMRYYFDSHHYTIEVGQKILDKILNKSNIESNDNFGVIITMNNIDKYNKEFYLEYKNWALNNKIIVKKINLLKNGG